MGIAILGFQADRDRFPMTGAPAAVPGPGNRWTLTPRARDVSGAVLTGEQKTWSWAWDLLPYLEKENLYRTGDDAFVRRRAVEIYRCPSRGSTRLVTVGPDGGAFRFQDPAVLSSIDYAGCVDHRSLSEEVVLGLVRPHTGIFRQNLRWDGKKFVPFEAPISLDHLKRHGASTTLMIGEKRIARGPLDPCQANDCLGYTAGFPVAAMSKGQPFELGFDTLASGLPRPRPDDGSLGGGFGSSHTGGMNALFADGHVQLISYDIDTAVFQALCNINDPSDIQLDDLNP
jgi:prepilin-type processing-associated H-X9-DG protein